MSRALGMRIRQPLRWCRFGGVSSSLLKNKTYERRRLLCTPVLLEIKPELGKPGSKMLQKHENHSEETFTSDVKISETKLAQSRDVEIVCSFFRRFPTFGLRLIVQEFIVLFDVSFHWLLQVRTPQFAIHQFLFRHKKQLATSLVLP